MTTKRTTRRVKRDLTNLTGLRLGLYTRASDDKRGQEKSVGDQGDVGERWADVHGCIVVARYVDNDRSASRFATKVREQFEVLLIDIRAGRLDVIWFWELSRSARRLKVYGELVEECAQRGILWVVGGRVHDLTSAGDRMSLGIQAVVAENESEQISERVLRGLASNAAAGRPHGKTPYGYVRRYDERTGAFAAQELDEVPRQSVGVDGTVHDYTAAGIVRGIFADLAGFVPLVVIERDLNERGIPGPAFSIDADGVRTPSRWRRGVLRKMALNPAYVAKLVHQGEVTQTPGLWPELIDGALFDTVGNLLSDPKRAKTRPARARHLLSYIARCECGGPMQATSTDAGHGPSRLLYRCLERQCAAIRADVLDAFVEVILIGWLKRSDLLAKLHEHESDADAVEARAEVEVARKELREWRDAMKHPDRSKRPSIESFVMIERQRQQDLDAAAARADKPLSVTMRVLKGDNPVGAWVSMLLPARREFLRDVIDIRLRPAGKGRRNVPLEDRVTITPGPAWPPAVAAMLG